MKGALKPFQVLWGLGVPNYCEIQALLNVVDFFVMHFVPK
jgi:hypothetical protein